MNTADFLFPRDLQLTATDIKKVLFIGSCLSDTYVKKLRIRNPGTIYDYVLFNNAADLPDRSPEEIGSYDLQYIQLSLRSVLTDAVIRIADNPTGRDSVDWIALGKRNIELMLEKAMSYRSKAAILTLISNFIVPQGRIGASLQDEDSEQDLVRVVRDLNSHLARETRKHSHVYMADVDMIANSLGKRFFLDDIIYFYTHGSVFYADWSCHERTPYWTAPLPGRIEEIQDLGQTYENKNDEFFDAVFRQIEAIYRTVKQIDTVKVVIFDLDNTMWRGQLAEDYRPGLKWPYTDGWPLGIWEAVHHLRRRGIVVTIVSKNDESAVVEKWSGAVDPPFVRYDDFLTPKVNWISKAENVEAILENLSLTPKSALFVDDNPVERESVKACLPGIRVIGSDPFVTRRILLWSPEMQIATRTQESARREEMLKQQFAREREKSTMSRGEFLRSLDSRVKITEITDSESRLFPRAFELVNKTNQFNTTGERWSLDDYQRHFHQGGRLFVFSAKDRFTDYGTVGVTFILDNRILQFVMSCRILGMDLELAVLSKCVELMRIDVIPRAINASIIHTEANTPCRDFFSKARFREVATNNFVLDISQSSTQVEHVEIEFSHG
jgi:FkbH-like protein